MELGGGENSVTPVSISLNEQYILNTYLLPIQEKMTLILASSARQAELAKIRYATINFLRSEIQTLSKLEYKVVD